MLALGFSAAMVVATLVFNLISDIIGGVWISVIEEETARPDRARRTVGQRSSPRSTGSVGSLARKAVGYAGRPLTHVGGPRGYSSVG